MGMSDAKILNLMNGYYRKLIEIRDSHQSGEKWFGYQQVPGVDKMEHALEMIPKMRVFLDEGRREKVFRWLGFLQGVFWMANIYTVEELANHSRPSKKDLKEQHRGHSFNTSQCERCAVTSMHLTGCKYEREFWEAPVDAFPIK